MTDYHVEYSAKALDDLKDIYRYIAEELGVPETAKRQLERIRKTIRALVTTPLRFSSVEWEPWKSMGMRKVPVNNYLVFYLLAEGDQAISIVRIFYGGRNIEEVLRSEE